MPREVKRLSRGSRGAGREGRYILNRAVTVGLEPKEQLGKVVEQVWVRPCR